MDPYLDYGVGLRTDIEHKSLYNWCIREFDKTGRQIDRDYIPWAWTLWFKAAEITVSIGASLKRIIPQDGSDTMPSGPDNFNVSEMIFGWLEPYQTDREKTRYSLLGTEREVPRLGLQIRRLSSGETEHCRMWGHLAWDFEHNFRVRSRPDALGIESGMSPERFDILRKSLETENPKEILVRLSRVAGFYSDWSPSSDTNLVKILVSKDEQKLTIPPEGSDIDPPVLGDIGEFEVQIQIAAVRNTPKPPSDEGNGSRIGADAMALAESDMKPTAVLAPILDEQAKLVRDAFGKFRIPLWIITGLLAAHLFVR